MNIETIIIRTKRAMADMHEAHHGFQQTAYQRNEAARAMHRAKIAIAGLSPEDQATVKAATGWED